MRFNKKLGEFILAFACALALWAILMVALVSTAHGATNKRCAYPVGHPHKCLRTAIKGPDLELLRDQLKRARH